MLDPTIKNSNQDTSIVSYLNGRDQVSPSKYPPCLGFFPVVLDQSETMFVGFGIREEYMV